MLVAFEVVVKLDNRKKYLVNNLKSSERKTFPEFLCSEESLRFPVGCVVQPDFVPQWCLKSSLDVQLFVQFVVGEQ